jgi:hypothetical protein
MAALKLKAGDDLPIKFTIVDSGGAVVDLTGGTIKFKIALTLGVTDAAALYTGTYTSFTNPTGGIHTETIPDTTTKDWEPGRYKYQSRFIDSSGIVQSENIDRCEIIENLLEDE